MANTITVTRNADNFTVEYNSIVRDHAFGDLDHYFDNSEDVKLFLKWRESRKNVYEFNADDDTIDIDGTTVFADAAAIFTALNTVIYP